MTERAYRIALAAQISGVKEPLIRQWEKRYGVLKPTRTAGGYRTYSDADIEVLKRLKALTAQGVSIAQAVQQLPDIRRDVKATAEAPPKPATMDQLAKWTAEVFDAAARFDQLRVDLILGEVQASMPPLAFYDDFLGPLLKQVGDHWHAGEISIAEEHLVSQAARQRMVALLVNAPRRAKKHVVCACPADEEHELGLLGVALHFRHAGWRVTYLGARTPAAQLARVVKGSKADLVALSLVSELKTPKYLEEISAALPEGVPVVIGGSGTRSSKAVIKKLGFTVAESVADFMRVRDEEQS
ncbi:MAG: transcriptional regulator [Archangium gephyra]|uniref:Transcriptional regulator n=1 Tax=Archangium gephyra TaxID=48 RepID=A0A2W5T562_9BACT|nr:MAG: transcriptional regulator [Archangium gephyra]